MPTEKDFHLAAGRLYATALMDLVKDAGPDRIADLREEVDALHALWESDERFRAFCNSVIIDREQRKTSLRTMFAGRLSREMLNLILVLCDHDRLMILDEVCQQFQLMRDAQLGRAHVHVTTAVPLDEDLREKLRAKVASLLRGRTPILHEHVKPEIVAGLVVQVGDHRADATAKRWLSEMDELLRAAGTRAIAEGHLAQA